MLSVEHNNVLIVQVWALFIVEIIESEKVQLAIQKHIAQVRYKPEVSLLDIYREMLKNFRKKEPGTS